MKTAAQCISLMLSLVLSLPAQAQDINTNTNTLTNTVTIGKPVVPPTRVVTPAKPDAAKPVAKPVVAKPAKPSSTPAPSEPGAVPVKKSPTATASATGGTSNANVTTDAKSSSDATGGAGGDGGAGGIATGGRATANAGSATANTAPITAIGSISKPSAASPTAPAIYTNAECSNAGSASVTTPLVGVALGGTAESVGCNARQDFNVFSASDLPNAAAAAMCLGTPSQRIAIEAEGVDCAILTKGAVRTVKAGGFDMAAYCQEPIGEWERAADRLKVCANLR